MKIFSYFVTELLFLPIISAMADAPCMDAVNKLLGELTPKAANHRFEKTAELGSAEIQVLRNYYDTTTAVCEKVNHQLDQDPFFRDYINKAIFPEEAERALRKALAPYLEANRTYTIRQLLDLYESKRKQVQRDLMAKHGYLFDADLLGKGDTVLLYERQKDRKEWPGIEGKLANRARVYVILKDGKVTSSEIHDLMTGLDGETPEISDGGFGMEVSIVGRHCQITALRGRGGQFAEQDFYFAISPGTCAKAKSFHSISKNSPRAEIEQAIGMILSTPGAGSSEYELKVALLRPRGYEVFNDKLRLHQKMCKRFEDFMSPTQGAGQSSP